MRPSCRAALAAAGQIAKDPDETWTHFGDRFDRYRALPEPGRRDAVAGARLGFLAEHGLDESRLYGRQEGAPAAAATPSGE